MIRKKISINDVAVMAGVSKTTVSRYLNGKYQFMSEETRKTIEKAIDKLDYSPSSMARSLKSKKSHMIGILTTDIYVPEVVDTLAGFSDALIEDGYFPLYLSTHNDRQIEKTCIETCIDQADAIIMRPIHTDFDMYTRLLTRGLPVILFDRYIEDWPYDAVYIDMYAAARKMVETVYDRGYHDIYFMASTEDPMNTRMIRKRAYVDFMKEKGIFDPDRILPVSISSTAFSIDLLSVLKKIDLSGKENAALLMDTSVLTPSVYMSLRSLGIRVPDQLAVCGYETTRQKWSEVMKPTLTTVGLPSYDMAWQAAKLAVRRIEQFKNPEEPIPSYEKIVLPATLTVRNSL